MNVCVVGVAVVLFGCVFMCTTIPNVVVVDVVAATTRADSVDTVVVAIPTVDMVVAVDLVVDVICCWHW